nr:diaminopropionate ammonia-lyase [uncultured Bacillus sp.]
MEHIKWKLNQNKNANEVPIISKFNIKEITKVMDFHRSFKGYQPTPLKNLENLSNLLGLSGFYVKDEAYRFGLNAFKVLGGSYAIGKYLSKQLGMDISDLSFEKLSSPEIRQKLGEVTFVTATDGNHGRGVAWAATHLGQKSVVFMPKGSSEERLKNIQREGANASITDLNYDDAVRLAASKANENGWVVIQDTAWEEYTDIPLWIMQGYATMAMEACQQLLEYQSGPPTHVFLQAGVGSLAGAVQAVLVNVFPDTPPKVIIVEPNAADCIYKSFMAGDGNPKFVGGNMSTIMAGLACGEPNIISWEILRNYSQMGISCPDWVAAKGMRILGNPVGNDSKVISGESGAVTTGIVSLLMTNPALTEVREKLELNKSSRVLVFSTEGDTDSKKYRSIVWDGECPSYFG